MGKLLYVGREKKLVGGVKKKRGGKEELQSVDLDRPPNRMPDRDRSASLATAPLLISKVSQ